MKKSGAQYVQEFSDYCDTRIGKKAVAYDDKNPNVWALFLKFAREMSLTGKRRYSAAMIVERIRWHTMVETKDDNFKISNDFRAYYGRKLMAHYDEFRGFFTTKETRQ